eukprot:3936166-Rhodomonas_salina.2
MREQKRKERAEEERDALRWGRDGGHKECRYYYYDTVPVLPLSYAVFAIVLESSYNKAKRGSS